MSSDIDPKYGQSSIFYNQLRQTPLFSMLAFVNQSDSSCIALSSVRPLDFAVLRPHIESLGSNCDKCSKFSVGYVAGASVLFLAI